MSEQDEPQPESPKPPDESGAGTGESGEASNPKVEARLNKLLRNALALYMSDKHLENKSEVLKSALGQFLEKEGYLIRTNTVGETPGEYKVASPDQKKNIGFTSKQLLRSQSLIVPPHYKFDGDSHDGDGKDGDGAKPRSRPHTK